MTIKELIREVCLSYNVSVNVMYNTSYKSRNEKECRWAVAYYTQMVFGGSIRVLKDKLKFNSIRPIQIGLKEYPKIISGEIISSINNDALIRLQGRLK